LTGAYCHIFILPSPFTQFWVGTHDVSYIQPSLELDHYLYPRQRRWIGANHTSFGFFRSSL